VLARPFFRRLAGDSRVNAYVAKSSRQPRRFAPALIDGLPLSRTWMTMVCMARTISFRSDDRTKSELRVLTRGRNTSEVLRELIHRSYLAEIHARAVADGERLSNDPKDQAELAAIAEEMNEIRAW